MTANDDAEAGRVEYDGHVIAPQSPMQRFTMLQDQSRGLQAKAKKVKSESKRLVTSARRLRENTSQLRSILSRLNKP